MKKVFNTDLIDKFLDDNCYSKAAFCKKAGISIATLAKIYKQERSLKILTITKIAAFMKFKTTDLCNTKMLNSKNEAV